MLKLKLILNINAHTQALFPHVINHLNYDLYHYHHVLIITVHFRYCTTIDCERKC